MLTPEVVANVVSVHGERGAVWIGELPRQIDELRRSWSLEAIGRPFAEARGAFVAPVRNTDGVDLVLRIVPRPEWAAHEITALEHWTGRGAVLLYAADRQRGALLLERAIPGDALVTLCSADDRAATAAAADVMMKLRATRGAAAGLPDLSTWLDGPGPALAATRVHALTDAWPRAASLVGDLLTGTERIVLHADLHHDNILSAQRSGWLAVDPKGVNGPAEAEAAALLRNPRRLVLSHDQPTALLADRIDILSERLGDDPQRLLLWAYVLAVFAAAWSVEDSEAATEATRWLACVDIIRVLARRRGAD